MATSGHKCEEVALGNVAAYLVKSPRPLGCETLQRGGGDPTSTSSDIAERQTI
jgi:hypothetical protein